MNRRHFVQTLAALPLAGCVGARAQSGTRKLSRVGVQLYTLRDDARRDLEGTLAAIRAAGYDDVELLGSMNNFGMAPARLRDVLDRVGLRAPSTHVAFAAIDTQLDRTLDEAATLGHEYVTVASIPGDRTRTVDGWRALADRFNEAGAVARRRNVWVGFHNHAGDIKSVAGGYDAFIERTDRAVTRHQLDTGNMAMAGIDPLAYMRRFGDRYWQFHIKDVPRLGAEADTELGKGVIDFRALLRMMDRIDEKHLYVEQETYPGAPVESARRDQAYLRQLEF